MSRHYVTVLSIAGSDSGGGAGIQADIKTISALGGYAATVVTAVTAQNTMGVRAISVVPADVVEAQVDVVMTDLMPRCVKIGMVGNRETLLRIASRLAAFPAVPVVVDPVMVATSGSRLTDDEAVDALVGHLIPKAALLTPNVPEAERIAGYALDTPERRDAAARDMLDMGCGAVLIKGGHCPADNVVEDWLYWLDDEGTMRWRLFSHPWIHTRNIHGTGCTLSSAIATHVAMGLPMADAVEAGIGFLCQALERGADVSIGEGHGPVNHLFDPVSMRIISN